VILGFESSDFHWALIFTGVWKSFVLARQVLYHLSHASSPFCYGSFGPRVFFSQVDLDHDLPILCFYASSHCWDGRCTPPCLTFFHWDEVLQTFLLRLACDPPKSVSCAAGNDRHVPLCPAIAWEGVLSNFFPRLVLNCDPGSSLSRS
jgi:hypothetical protein